MCGIVGYLELDEHSLAGIDLQKMAKTLHHRGPDAAGYFEEERIGLAHKRLSIIDLSDAANQPMQSHDGRYVIVFNGEIYNYVELRSELMAQGYQFRSKGDTEVLLNLFHHYGEATLSKVDGMFAFAIWDREQRTLFAARDPFGIKPLYFTIHEGCFIFASEMKAIFAAMRSKPEVSPEGLADYLALQYTLADHTLYKNIFKLQPAHSLHINRSGALHVKKYWQPSFKKIQISEEEAESEMARILSDSIRIQLRSDVPLGFHLSGGLDTASIACFARKILPELKMHTFTGGFREGSVFDDTAFARITSKRVRSIHHEIFPDAKDFTDTFEKIMWFMDEPAAAPGIFPQYFVSRLAAENVKVVLGGQGADELLGGYVRHYLLYYEAALKAEVSGEKQLTDISIRELTENIEQLKGYAPLMKSFFSRGLFDTPEERYYALILRDENWRAAVSPDWRRQTAGYDPYETYRKIFNAHSDMELLDRVLYFEMSASLPALLQVEDRTSMAHSIESRVPFLTTRMAEFLFSLPSRIKFKNGRLKHLQRQMARGVIPDEILNRKDKLGFPVPLNQWAKNESRNWFHSLLQGKYANQGIFEKDLVEQALNPSSEHGRALWGAMCVSSTVGQFC